MLSFWTGAAGSGVDSPGRLDEISLVAGRGSIFFQRFFSFFSEPVSIMETKFSDRKETENMKISVGALKGNTLTTHRNNFLISDRPARGGEQSSPDGLGGSG